MSSTFQAGSETRVDTLLPDSHPTLAALADGTFVLVWQAERPAWETDGRLSYGSDLFWQHLDAAGTPIGPVQAYGPVANDQAQASVAALGDGGFAVAFASQLDYDGRFRTFDFGVASVEFGAGGQTREGPGTRSWTNGQAGDQDDPAIAVLTDGSVQVAWATTGSAEAGLPRGVAMPFGFIEGASDPALAALAGGGLAAAWVSDGGVHARAANGTVVDVSSNGSDPVLAGLADGSFVVAWREGGSAAWMRHFSATGASLGSAAPVSEQPGGPQDAPAVAALAGGGFVVAWQSPDGDGNGIFYRQFDAQGQALGATLRVNGDAAGEQSDAAVAASAAGGFTVAWTDGADLAVRHFGLPLDWCGHEGMAWRLYQAAFDRLPDLGGLQYQTGALDSGLALGQVAAHFIASPEFQARYGTPDDTAFVTQLYANVLHRAPDEPGLAYHVGHLAGGWSRADVLTGFSESPENQALVVGVFQAAMPDV